MVRLVYRFYLQNRGTFQEARIIGILIFQQCVACLVIILTPYGITILAYGNKLLLLEIICLLYQPTATYWQIVYMTVFQVLRRISSYFDLSKSCYLITALTVNSNLEVMASLNQEIQRDSMPQQCQERRLLVMAKTADRMFHHQCIVNQLYASMVHLQPLQSAKYTIVLNHYSFQLKLQAPIYVKLKFSTTILNFLNLQMRYWSSTKLPYRSVNTPGVVHEARLSAQKFNFSKQHEPHIYLFWVSTLYCRPACRPRLSFIT
uniref:Uncharacterized protein n=1 Tax=Spironucleus salmonicida TaxID=348837 RepID=V6LZV7_9EUKA|eukprot:EST46389.1 Hypothetical protein SS50377_13593 [Spironucleus salmonicida]